MTHHKHCIDGNCAYYCPIKTKQRAETKALVKQYLIGAITLEEVLGYPKGTKLEGGV